MPTKHKRKKPADQIAIAKERIVILFQQAEKKAILGELDLADRYVEIARKIGMRYNVRIPKDLKRRFCKNCYSYLLPGLTCRQRMKKGIVTIHCLQCNKIMRYPVKKSKRSK